MEPKFLSEKVISYILLNSSFISNLGLFHGKMGIALFFAHYARFTKQTLYDDFAGELLDEIYDNISVNMPVDLENGLCGIGWGIEYLLRNSFMEGSSDEILEEIDRKVMERDPRRIIDMSFRKGLGGIMYYILARLTSFRTNQKIPFDKQYLYELCQVIQNVDFRDESAFFRTVKEDFVQVVSGSDKNVFPLLLPPLLFDKMPDVNKELALIPLGIEKGIISVCLREMFET